MFTPTSRWHEMNEGVAKTVFQLGSNIFYVSMKFHPTPLSTQCCLDLSSRVLKLQGCGEELPFLNPSTDSQCQHDTNENLWAGFDSSTSPLVTKTSGLSDHSVSYCQNMDEHSSPLFLSLHHCLCGIKTFTMIISSMKISPVCGANESLFWPNQIAVSLISYKLFYYIFRLFG